jgi:hypothetical protein
VARTIIQAVVFDLYETLITEYESDWHRGATPAERLGVPPDVFDRAWRSYARARMTEALDYGDVLRAICHLAGVVVDARVESVIAALHRERLVAKAKPLLELERPVLDALSQLRAKGLKLGLVSNCSVKRSPPGRGVNWRRTSTMSSSPARSATPSRIGTSSSWRAVASAFLHRTVRSSATAEAMSWPARQASG